MNIDRHIAEAFKSGILQSSGGSQDWWLRSSVIVGGAVVAVVIRQQGREAAWSGVKNLVSNFIPIVVKNTQSVLKNDVASVVGDVVSRFDAKSDPLVDAREPPLVLKMRDKAPPSFWDPERYCTFTYCLSFPQCRGTFSATSRPKRIQSTL
jgi:hypothetical protein